MPKKDDTKRLWRKREVAILFARSILEHAKKSVTPDSQYDSWDGGEVIVSDYPMGHDGPNQ
jgi:hypothetical protein